MEDRISLIGSSGISLRQTVSGSTVKVSPALLTWHPKYSKICTAASTSDRRGQLCRMLRPSHKRVAAKIGRTLFLAPLHSDFSLDFAAALNN